MYYCGYKISSHKTQLPMRLKYCLPIPLSKGEYYLKNYQITRIQHILKEKRITKVLALRFAGFNPLDEVEFGLCITDTDLILFE